MRLLVAAALGIASSACGAQPPAERRPVAPPHAPPAARPVPAPAPAVVPSPPAPAAISDDASWGGAGPIAVLAAAPTRGWVAFCEVRRDTNGDGTVGASIGPRGEWRGDRPDAFWSGAAGGPGEPIDAFVGSDPSGRFVALVREGRLILTDTTTQVVVTLNADVRDDRAPFRRPRVAEFDPTGRRLAYVGAAGTPATVVVRELATGLESPLPIGAGELWRPEFDLSGEWIVARVVSADSNGNGRLDWPSPPSPPTARCPSPLPRYSLPEKPGDEASTRIAPAAGGAFRDEPGLVVPLRTALVVREADGALVRVAPDGVRRKIVDATCASRILHADTARDLLLVTCLKKSGKSDVRLLAPNGVRPLGIEVAQASGDRWTPGAPRLVPLYPGADTVLVDLERRSIERLKPGDRVITTNAHRALVLRGRRLVAYEVGAAEKPLGGEITPLQHVLRTGTVVALPPFAVDAAAGTVLGRVPASPLALAADGSVLVADAPADASRLARGPLRWVRPAPAEGAPAP